MSQLILKTPDGKKEIHQIKSGTILLGRKGPANIILNKPNVSSRHAQIIAENETIVIKDLQSSNGTYVNKKRISEQQLSDGDTIRIGDFTLIFQENGDTAAKAEEHVEKKKTGEKKEKPSREKLSHEDKYFKIKVLLHDLLIDRMDLKKLSLKQTGDDELRKKTLQKIDELIKEMERKIPSFVDRKLLKKELLNDTLGLGPIEDLLADDTVTEIMVNRPEQIYIERAGKLVLSNKRFLDDSQVFNTSHRVVAPLGRSINERSPLVDARLAYGSRVTAVIPALAVQGSALTIRSFYKRM